MYLEIGFHGPLRFAPPEILQPTLANLLDINQNRISQDIPFFAQARWIPSFRAITTSGRWNDSCFDYALICQSLLSYDYKFPWHLNISSFTLGLKERCPIQKYIVGFKY